MERDYRQTLRRALVERCQRNPKYSLRAFARDLGFSPARLSDVLNGKKGISGEAAVSVAKALSLSPRESELFRDQVESLHARSRVGREQAGKRVEARTASAQGAHNLTVDAFRIVSDWYHFAILQLMKLPSYQESPQWIAKALGLKPVQVTEAIERFQRLELVEKKGGRLVPAQDYVSSPDGIPSEAIRKFHEQLLQKALAALVTQPVGERDFLASTLPVALADVPRARERVREFNRALCEELSHNPRVERVYALSVQFFDLTPDLKHLKEKP